MPAATSQSELLAAFDKTLALLKADIAGLSEAEGNMAWPEGDAWSIKAILYHRAHWIDLFFQWVAAENAGETPAVGVKWNELKAYNGALLPEAGKLSWADVYTLFEAKQAALRAWIAVQDGGWLYQTGHYPWMNKWTLGRWAESAGPAHFRSARKGIRKILKENC